MLVTPEPRGISSHDRRAGTAGRPPPRARGGNTLSQVMQQSESLASEWWPVGKVRPYSGNPRNIPDIAIETVAASIREFGWRQPIVVDQQGEIIVGHTRWLAAKRLRLKKVPVHVAADLTPAQIKAYRLADNRAGELTSWNPGLLQLELVELGTLGVNLAALSLSSADLAGLLPPSDGDEGLAGGGGGGVEPADRGRLLDLINVTIAEPKHQVEKGDHFGIGERHHLLCVGVMTDWPRWTPLLAEGAIFCPYPGPFVPYGKRADDHSLVLVQPDPYTAGHILDRYAEIHGAGAVRKL